MFFDDMLESFFKRFNVENGSPKKFGVVTLAVLIAIIFTGNLIYWLFHTSEIFTFKFIQDSVEVLFPWIVITGVAVIFMAPGYVRIRDKLFDIAPAEEPEDSNPKGKARRKAQEESSQMLDEKETPSSLTGIEDKDIPVLSYPVDPNSMAYTGFDDEELDD